LFEIRIINTIDAQIPPRLLGDDIVLMLAPRVGGAVLRPKRKSLQQKPLSTGKPYPMDP